ncbi:MAG: efflux RND transporter permease subunit [Rhodothermales bacterium]
MRIPKLALDNYQFTLVLMLLLTLMGVVSLLTMPRLEDPTVNFPGVNVIAVYPGATPADVEQMVVDPIEEAINSLDDLKDIETRMQDGLAVIGPEFLHGTDPDKIYDDVSQAVNNLRGELPAELVRLEVQKISPQDVNIVQLALVSEDASYRELTRLVEDLEQQLERVSGVRAIETWAYPEEEVRISIDLEKMRPLGLTLSHVTQAIQASSANIPGGNVDAGTRRFNIRTSGDYESLDDIRRTVITAAGDRIVYLDDVADVDYAYADEAYMARVDGERAVFLSGTQRAGTNIFDVTDRMKAVMSDFETTLPENVRLVTVFDQAASVAYQVNGFFRNLLQGLLLVGLIALVALGFRAASIVLIAIPISIFMAINWLDLTGFALQQISIVGLVIALGLLVDNAIVVTENINRFLGQGLSRREAALQGTGQIGWAVVSSTATTVLSFVPMLMLQTGTGDFIRTMPLTVIYALGASLIVSLTLTPFLASRFLKSKPSADTAPTKRPNVFQRTMQRVVDGPYRTALGGALRKPWLVLGTAIAIFVGSLALFPIVGVSLFPKAEKPLLMVDIDLPEGSALTRTDAVTRDVEAFLAEHPHVERYTTNVGHGNPRIYYNLFPKSETPTYSQIVVHLDSRDPAVASTTVRDLRDTFGRYPGADVQVSELLQGPPLNAPIAFRVTGDDLSVIETLAAQVEAIITQASGTINIDNPSSRRKTDLHVAINRDKAGLLGVPLVEVDQTVRASIAGTPVARFRDTDGEDYDVIVRLPIDSRPSLDDFDQISVASVTGARIPLRQIASIEFASGPSEIRHFELERNTLVTADVDEGYNVAEVTGRIIEQLDAMEWPAGYTYLVSGEQESREESFGGMGQALLIALLGIFGVLVLQFRSFSQPMIVFAAIPFAITGAVFALFLTGYSFSFMAFVGLTSLIGIVVNNSIILVDYANQLREQGASIVEAVREASATRFTPILLTTLTTIGGLLPLTLQNSTLWSPLGWAIIGGLAVSMLLTLFVVPVLYKLFTREVTVAA